MTAGGPDAATPPRVVAVVLNWNGGTETAACLSALAACTGVRPTVLLADNGSRDGSVEAAEASHPGLVVLRFGSNLGFAGGNNRAVEHAFATLGADWVCLLNSDLVVQPDTFTRLLDAAAHLQHEGRGPVGALGPCLLYRDEPGTVWACGGRVGPALNVTQLLDHGRRNRPAGAPRAVDYVPGACLLVRREAWAAAGPLDESFFCYLEDADWCLRCRQAGFSVFVVPEALAYHGLSSSTGGGYTAGRKYMTGVNSVHFLRKHGSLRGWVALFLFDLVLWPLALLRGMLSGRTAGAVAKLRGVIDGLRGAHVDADIAARYARRTP